MTDEPNATDAAVKLAEESGVDLSAVVGTGAEGRVTKPDVEAYLTLRVKPEEQATPAPAGGEFTTAGAEPDPPVITVTAPAIDVEVTNLSAVARAHLLAADVTAYMRPDPIAAEIMALPMLGACIHWAGDREKYADVLRARAAELLG